MGECDTYKEMMNKMMKKYIDQVRADPSNFIKDKTALQRLLELGDNEKKIILYPDKGSPSFNKTLLSAYEWDFLMLECLIIACMDRTTSLPNDVKNGAVLGVLIAYLVEYFLIWIRNFKGKKNLSMHTLSDERFLI